MKKEVTTNVFEGYIDKNNQVCFGDGTFMCDVTQLYEGSHLDENGYLIEKIFAGFQNVKRCDADQIYGIRYKHDEKGRIIEEQFIGVDGSIKGNSFGLAIKLFAYDEKDDWCSVTYLNPEKKQSHDGNNCCIVKLEYDQWGNRIKETYFTIDGTFCPNSGNPP